MKSHHNRIWPKIYTKDRLIICYGFAPLIFYYSSIIAKQAIEISPNMKVGKLLVIANIKNSHNDSGEKKCQ